MSGGDDRNRMRARVAGWHTALEQLRNERKTATAAGRRALLGRLQELQEKIAQEVREWNAGIDEYDADPAQTTQKEFEDRPGLRELQRQISSDLADWKKE